MAHDMPWYKRNGADFVMGTLGMPDSDHKWAYSACIDMMNDRGRPIPDDAAFICGFTGLSRKKWSIVRAYLLDHGKLIQLDDTLSNPRFERERVHTNSIREARREAGRAGGIASGEARAAKAQQQLPLEGEQKEDHPDYQGDYRAIYRGDKRPDSAPDTSETHPPHSLKTNEKTGSKSQASRARERASETRDQNTTTPTSSSNAAKAPVVDDGDKDDLLGLTQAVCDAAGLSARIASRPALLTQSMDIVRSWIAAGVDIRGTAIPVIESATERATEPAHSLNRFAAAVDTAHARKRAADRNGTAPPPKPVTAAYEIDGEAPPMVEFRKAIAQAIGVAVYARWCRALKFTVEDLRNEGDMGLLAVRKNGNGSGANDPARVLDQHGKVMTAIARKLLGVREVWEQFDKGDRQAHSNKPSAVKP